MGGKQPAGAGPYRTTYCFFGSPLAAGAVVVDGVAAASAGGTPGAGATGVCVGAGLSVTADGLELQGDHREKVAERLGGRYRVKLAGG